MLITVTLGDMSLPGVRSNPPNNILDFRLGKNVVMIGVIIEKFTKEESLPFQISHKSTEGLGKPTVCPVSQEFQLL
jgi:hypothetical protein